MKDTFNTIDVYPIPNFKNESSGETVIVTAHDGFRGLTLDEYNACAELELLTTDELPAYLVVEEV